MVRLKHIETEKGHVNREKQSVRERERDEEVDYHT